MRRRGLLTVLLLAACTSAPTTSPTAQPAAPAPTSTPTPVARTTAWADEFNGPAGAPADPASWSPDTGAGGWGNHELQDYQAQNAQQDGKGHLVLTARRTSAGWTSARINTLGKQALGFGTVAVRAKVPAGQGLWPAIWTQGTAITQVGWPRCGEADVLETVNGASEAIQTGHGPLRSGKAWALEHRRGSLTSYASGFHTYAMTRRPGLVAFSVDGVVTARLTPKDVPHGGTWTLDGPQFLLLDLAVGGDFPGAPDRSTPRTATFLIDWVRYYAR